MSNGLGRPLAPDLDADGFPLFPALPGSRQVPTAARSLARLVAGLRTGVICARTRSLAAMIVFLDREPIDGLAVRDGERVTGPDVLDEIASVPIDQVTVTELQPELAAVLGSYFLPTTLRGIPAGVLDPDTFIQSVARPGQRGCVLVRGADALGLVFVDRGQVRLAYREDDDDLGGLERVAGLLEDPAATIWARVGATTGGARPPRVEEVERPVPVTPPPEAPPPPPPEAPPPPPPEAPEVDREPEVEPAPADEPLVSGWAAPDPAQPPTTVAASMEAPAPGEAPGGGDLLETVLAEVRQALGPHAVRVEPVFRAAEPTPEGLRAAARSLRERRVRLLSPATMDLVASRVLAALGR